MLKRTLFISIAIFASLNVCAQAIQADFDKKVIYVDSLNMPRNTPVKTLIAMLPELLQRPGTFILSNYDVQIEGMSVGNASDVALDEMQIVDIEKMEVSESPVSSYKNNGQGGSINFVLRSSGTNGDHEWGSIGLMTSNLPDLFPQFIIGHKKGKFMVRGVVLGELYRGDTDELTLTYKDDKFSEQSYQNNLEKFRTAMTRAYMEYQFTKYDKLNFNISNIYTYDKQYNYSDFAGTLNLEQMQKSFNLQTSVEFKHEKPRHSIKAKVEYAYTPTHSDYDYTDKYIYTSKNKPNNFSGNVEFKSQLLKGVSASGKEKLLELTVGSNFNANISKESIIITDVTYAPGAQQTLNPANNTYYLMPFMTVASTLGKLKMKLTGEFQHFRYEIERKDKLHSVISNEFTGKLMTEWHLTNMKTLRLILDRKLERPSSDQLFPYLIFDTKRMGYVRGNPELDPIRIHEVTIDYIASSKWNDLHKLTLNAGISHSWVNNIITEVHNDTAAEPGSLGLSLDYVTFLNLGNSSILSTNLMALYSYKSFSLSLTGNIYHKMYDENADSQHYTYYNISFHPYFNLKDGWHGGAKIAYYSRADRSDGSLGDGAVANMTIGKAWSRFFVYVTQNVSILKNSRDETITDNVRTEKTYNMVESSIAVGMKYTF